MNDLPFDYLMKLMKEHNISIYDYLELPNELPDVAKITLLIGLKTLRKKVHRQTER